MQANFIYISTFLFGFLYAIWSKDTVANKLFTFIFLVMFLFGGFVSLQILGFIV